MNKFSNRPLAPHLTAYSIQGSSLFSIWHRMSAVFLTLFIILSLFTQKLFIWTFYSIMLHNVSYFLQQTINSYTLFFVYILISYHMINGSRHILWDLGFFLMNKDVIKANVIITLTLFNLQVLFYKNFFL